jgi:uncharacterized protein (TIGR03437 family)
MQLGPVLSADRSGKSAMMLRSADGSVSPGTRLVKITLTFANNQAAVYGMHGYTDNVEFVSASGAVAIQDAGIVNSATGVFGPVAPGEMVTILTSGINLASITRMQLDAAGSVMTSLANVKVFFDGTQAPLLYVNSSQIGAIVPFDADGKANVAVRMEHHGARSQTVSMPVASTSPGIFTQDGLSKGAGLIFNADYSLNSRDNPAVEGSAVSIYWTAGGRTDPPGVDGQMAFAPLPRPKVPVTVTIGGNTANLICAGGLPHLWAGLLTAEVAIPAGSAAPDPVPVVITAGSAPSPNNSVVMWIRGQ